MVTDSKLQRIVVFQQSERAAAKIRWIGEHGRGMRIERVLDLPVDLPAVIDEPEVFLPERLNADLVLDYLKHPDLTHALALACKTEGIPVVASGRRVPVEGLFSPPTCCGLARHERLGVYAEQFGAPELSVQVEDGRIAHIEVQRGSPCGSTWEAALAVAGLPVEEAVARYGLEVQLRCQADPANWDPLYGKSPVHFAGRVHAGALGKALKKS
jgi:hypothetical protein